MKKIFNIILFMCINFLVYINFNNIVDFVVKLSESDGLPTSYINEVEENLIDNDTITLVQSKDTYNFDNDYYIYYSMLNDNQKEIYKQIYINANEYNNTFKPIINISVKELKDTIEALNYDHPELFWLSNNYSYKYTKDNNCVQITISFYFDINEIDSIKELFNKELNKIVNKANRYSTDYDKELYVHNYLINNVEYINGSDINQSAYSAIINKKSVCAGYAKAFQLIMSKLNIISYYVIGQANNNHAWNIVKINNRYYNVDLTWDDTGLDKYKYFNVSDNYISSTHTRLRLSNGLPNCY